MKFLITIILSFLFAINIPARTNIAASVQWTDVKAARDLSSSGDVVIAPAGTAIWKTNIAFNGVSFFGAGMDATKIIDEVPRTQANKQLLIFSGDNWQFGGITITGSLNVTAINYDGTLKIGGADWRIHDLKLINLYAVAGVIKARRGLVDHCIFKLPINEAFQIYDADTVGYVSWNTPVKWGTTDCIRMQDNNFADNGAYPALDFYGGSRADISHNVFTNSSIGNHGTDSSQVIISCRSIDVHDNVFIFPTGTPNTPWPFAIYMRGGTARIWGNEFRGRFSAAVRADMYREKLSGVDGAPNWVPWGPITGTNVWDGNTDSIGYPGLHAIGRGTGDLLAGNPPLNVTRGNIKMWTHDILDPVYCWSNTVAIDNPTWEMRSSTELVQENRDYFQHTKDPAYTGPLTYPDPLIQSVTPPSLPPSSPLNPRIISAKLEL